MKPPRKGGVFSRSGPKLELGHSNLLLLEKAEGRSWTNNFRLTVTTDSAAIFSDSVIERIDFGFA